MVAAAAEQPSHTARTPTKRVMKYLSFFCQGRGLRRFFFEGGGGGEGRGKGRGVRGEGRGEGGGPKDVQFTTGYLTLEGDDNARSVDVESER